jgi:hypothetical protein
MINDHDLASKLRAHAQALIKTNVYSDNVTAIYILHAVSAIEKNTRLHHDNALLLNGLHQSIALVKEHAPTATAAKHLTATAYLLDELACDGHTKKRPPVTLKVYAHVAWWLKPALAWLVFKSFLTTKQPPTAEQVEALAKRAVTVKRKPPKKRIVELVLLIAVFIVVMISAR